MSGRIVALASLVVLTATARSVSAAPEAVDFAREVRPILSANCFKCHGADEKARKSDLRLDVRDGALAEASSGERAVVPGRPDESELVRRILTDDAEDVMPPPAAKKTLTAAEKDVLKRWVAQGAEYKPHWAWLAPKQSTPPAVNQADWPTNEIDRFVLARLEAEGLKPSPRADRYTLVRRVYLDLIGLPPTPEEADAFAGDETAGAYERLVDKLLASPAYGERWARRWLDLARYADTNGYEKDRQRSIWPYRDWVIDAINSDMPFDRFTVEQLAGDMLPGATPQQKIATGFHRNTMLNEEGGIDPLEFRFHAVADRVGTTGTTWLGLTVACAQCHTHKYDPITHTEYYGLMAFLNNADEPEMAVPKSDADAKRREVEEKIARLTAELPDKLAAPDDAEWHTPPKGTAAAKSAGGATARLSPEGVWTFAGESPDRDAYTIQFDAPAEGVDRIRLETLRVGRAGPGRTKHGNFVLSEFEVTVAPKDSPEKAQPVKLVRAEADGAQDGFPVAHAIDGNPATGWAVHEPAKEMGDRAATFHFEKPVTYPQGARWTVKLDQQYGQQHTIRRLRLSVGKKAEAGPDAEKRRRDALDKSFTEWDQRESAKAVKWTVLRPAGMKSSMPFLTLLDDASVLASGDITKSDTYDLTFRTDLKAITAVRIEALPHESLPRHGPGLIYYEGPIGDFSLSEIKLSAGGKDAKFSKAAHSFASGKNTAATSIDGNPQTGWMIDGGQGRAHYAVFGLEGPADASGELKLRMLFERHFAPALGRFRVSVSTDPRAADASALPPDVEEVLATPAGERTAEQRDRLFRHYLTAAPQLAEARKQIEDLRRNMPRPPTTLVMSERPPRHVRPTHLHHRGEFLQPREQVKPGVPSFLPPLPSGEPANRLTFARWLVSPENPLTARVTVNRQWQALFGRGIVRTTEDFGFQGELPSHPELLDWLAVEFVRQGWSMKKLHRLIVTSSTYQQSSRVTTESLARDPQNVLIARGARFRAEAEIIRDSALRASGLLSAKIGGPSVFPPQPPTVTTEGTYGPMTWTASTGEDRYRRSLYTFMKRTAPFALYNTFDAPSGEACVARREVSNTPLQALSLLNDAVFVECAQALGKAAAEMQAPDEARATALFRRCLTRPPAGDELAALLEFATKQRERFKKNELDPAKVAGGKEGDVIERATWTAAARAVMNLDEAVTKN